MDATNAADNNGTAGSITGATNRAAEHAARIAEARSYDEPYRFGRRPTTRAPFPFTEREFARPLVVRSRLHADPSALDTQAG